MPPSIEAVKADLLALQTTLDDLARRIYAHMRQQRERTYSTALRSLNPTSEN